MVRGGGARRESHHGRALALSGSAAGEGGISAAENRHRAAGSVIRVMTGARHAHSPASTDRRRIGRMRRDSLRPHDAADSTAASHSAGDPRRDAADGRRHGQTHGLERCRRSDPRGASRMDGRRRRGRGHFRRSRDRGGPVRRRCVRAIKVIPAKRSSRRRGHIVLRDLAAVPHDPLISATRFSRSSQSSQRP
jgi:hypothetical protein